MQALKNRGRPTNKDRQLNQELIIYMGKALMREQGEVPSIRGLARALNVDAMSIYHYFENKNSLLEAILTSLMDSIYFPKQNLQWQESLFLLTESYLTLLRNYKGLLETLITMSDDGPIMVFAERFNKIITPLNLSTEKQTQSLSLLLSFLHGQALLPVKDIDASHLELKQLFQSYCIVISDK